MPVFISDQAITIIRQHRKTISLQINPDAALTVKIPFLMPKKFAYNFINEKQDWIIKKQQEVLKRNNTKEKKFAEGEIFQYMGINYPLKIVPIQTSPLELRSTHFSLCKFNQPKARQYFISWYKKKALETVTRRIQFYATQHKLSYGTIKIADTSSQWGSCSSTGNLSFKWQLILAPLMVIDYVVVHELSHLTHHNHSTSFWKQVHTIYPQYIIYRRWLQKNGHKLHL